MVLLEPKMYATAAIMCGVSLSEITEPIPRRVSRTANLSRALHHTQEQHFKFWLRSLVGRRCPGFFVVLSLFVGKFWLNYTRRSFRIQNKQAAYQGPKPAIHVVTAIQPEDDASKTGDFGICVCA